MAILKSGDTIGFIAPSAGLQDKDLSSTLDYFQKLNLNIKLSDNIKEQYRYMAGSDKQRASAINKMFATPKIKALFCIRGGAGSTRMLEYLDYDLIKQNPKPIIGLSDSTALQNAIYSKTKSPSLTGFLPLYDLKNNTLNKTIDASLKSSLFDETHIITSGTCFIKGKTKAPIIGGCLSVLLYLCGTPFFPDLKGKILLLEDVEEKTYKIDLMLNQLKKQKNFNKLKGIIFGAFTDCPIVDKEDGTIEDCINDFTKDLNIPIITNFEYGHIPSRYLLPIGINVTMTSSPKGCSISW
ncbi:MAG: LD-carboxypeptidase [Alphaproteobacteria bacterium]|nr:LD-carboxypeptidase [Alphaproteobacteria bacterium]